MSDDPMTNAMLRLCNTIEMIGGTPARPGVDQARARLHDAHLRLAVVGRVKAGKSTLVNAIIGRRIAATDEAECTSMVTHYAWGAPERGEVHLRDGRIEQFALVDRRVPDSVGYPPSEVSHLVVFLQESALRDFALIDTPGLATTTTANDEATRRAMLEARQADALVYVFRDVSRADDVEVLRDFTEVSGRATTGAGEPSSAIGVLSHADTFGAGTWGETDPFDDAGAYAATIAAQRAAELSTVIPVSGLMAQSVATGQVTENVTRALGSLVSLDEAELRYPDDDQARAIDTAATVLGDYGVRYGRSVAAAGSGSLSEWLSTRSNEHALRRALRDRYVGRHRQLKGRQALNLLTQVANAAGPLHWQMSQAISEALLSPELHPLAELNAWEELRYSAPSHPVVATLERLTSAPDDARRVGLGPSADSTAIRKEAIKAVNQARADASLAITPGLASACTILERSFTLIAHRQSM
ncbi:MAG: 50S ribosome-binding GTPase [Micrococcales bacterium]|nr:50S ribosome-binding GTPase [Micrococcales bacterium]